MYLKRKRKALLFLGLGRTNWGHVNTLVGLKSQSRNPIEGINIRAELTIKKY